MNQCPICLIGFSRRDALLRHQRNVHSSNERDKLKRHIVHQDQSMDLAKKPRYDTDDTSKNTDLSSEPVRQEYWTTENEPDASAYSDMDDSPEPSIRSPWSDDITDIQSDEEMDEDEEEEDSEDEQEDIEDEQEDSTCDVYLRNLIVPRINEPRTIMETDRMNNPKYVNWIIAGTALHCVKEGISEFVDTHAQKLHEHIKDKIEQAYPGTSTRTCGACGSHSIKKTKNRPTWTIQCVNNVCNHWLDAILSVHATNTLSRHKCPTISWDNVDPTLWPTRPWEVAKVFQPYGCSGHQGPGDSDCTGLLTLMLECQYFHQFISNKQILHDLKDHRNKIMHTGTLEVEDSNLRLWTDDMIRFLEDPKYLHSLPQCQQSVTTIKKLRDSPLQPSLSKDQETEALRQLAEGLNNDVKCLQADMGMYKREMDELKASDEKSHEQIKDMEDNITELQSQIEKNINILRQLDGDDVKLEISDMRTKLQALEEQCSRGMSQLAVELRGELDAMRQQLDHVAQTFQPEGAAKGPKLEDVRRDLIKIYRENCSYVPIYPLAPEITTKLLKSYVKPCLQRVNSFNLDGSETTGESSFTGIFNSANKPCRNIYIVGESGVGKSTLCDYMVQQWCGAHLDRGDHVEDEEAMRKFPLLFYISLRHASPTQNIEEMIKDQLIDIDVENIIDENCLIVLDGLDEWKADINDMAETRFRHKGLPSLKSKCNCTIVTTSRPWKLESLRLSDREIDHEIHITGLDVSSSKRLATNLINELNAKYQSDKESVDFIKEVNSHGLNHFMKTPVVLKQMLCLWYDDIPFENSQCEIYTSLIERQLQLAEQQNRLNTTLVTQTTECDGMQLPDALQNAKYPFCEKYQKLLLALAKMAFHTLINGDRESALVFDHTAVSLHGMNENEVEICLKIGLLSQKQLYGRLVERKKNLNFIHKSYHEYFAALQLASYSKCISFVKDVCSTHQMLREIEDVPRFLCVMSPHLCRELVSHLRKVVSADSDLVQYRINEGKNSHTSHRILKNIQSVILNLTTELEHSGHHQHYPLPINDLVVDKSNIDFIESKLGMLDTCDIESIIVEDTSVDVSVKFNSLLETVGRSKSLRKVSIDDTVGCLNAEKVNKLISNSQKSLSSLKVVGVDFAGLIWSDPFQRMFKQLSHLSSINFQRIQLRAKQLKALLKFLSRASELRELHLRGIVSELYGYPVCLKSQLEYLYLQDLNAGSITLHTSSLKVCSIEKLHTPGCAKSLFRCLRSASQLKHIDVAYIENAEDKNALVNVLPQLENIKYVSVRHVDFAEQDVALSPTMKNLKNVHFFQVTMSNVALSRMLENLPPQTLAVDLDMLKLVAAADMFDVPRHIRESTRYSVIRCYKTAHKWRILFDKKTTI